MTLGGGHPVILFDGVCNLCNATVRFVIERDRRGRFRFAPLQAPAAQTLISRLADPGTAPPPAVLLSETDREGPASIILVEGSRAYVKSTAALRIARHLGGVYRALYALVLVPRFIRDAVYDFVARNRYGWFGKRDACMVPTPELRDRFLS